MFRKSFLILISTLVVILTGQAAAFSQTAPVSGKVELLKADGTREAVPGALIEVYRTDIKGSFPSAKTNKKGEFIFAGMPYGAEFAFSVSAPNASPTIFPKVKAGDEKIVVTMNPGNGGKFTEAEARKALAGGGVASEANPGGTQPEKQSAEATEDQKQAQAEFEKKNAEITAKNEKTVKTNELVARALKEGNDAYTAKNFDLAVAKYDEGIAADPDFVGSAPVLNSNRAKALLSRALTTFNASIKMENAEEKTAARAKVKKDLGDASQGFLRAWNLLKTPPPANIMSKDLYDSIRLATLGGAVETFSKAARIEQIDQTMVDAAKILIPEYLALETDPAKKHVASLALADLYRVFGDSENAITAYNKVLETSPDDADALAGAGFSLVNIGFLNNDKTKLQEGSNLLQKFASIAPDTNKYKADALALIETLKKEQNVAPQKVAPTPKKRT